MDLFASRGHILPVLQRRQAHALALDGWRGLGPGTATTPLTGTTWTAGTSYDVQLNAQTQYHSGEAAAYPALGNDLFAVSIKVDGVVVATASAYTDKLTNTMTHYNLTLTPTGNTPVNPECDAAACDYGIQDPCVLGLRLQ
jgi:hypothetical protein